MRHFRWKPIWRTIRGRKQQRRMILDLIGQSLQACRPKLVFGATEARLLPVLVGVLSSKSRLSPRMGGLTINKLCRGSEQPLLLGAQPGDWSIQQVCGRGGTGSGQSLGRLLCLRAVRCCWCFESVPGISGKDNIYRDYAAVLEVSTWIQRLSKYLVMRSIVFVKSSQELLPVHSYYTLLDTSHSSQLARATLPNATGRALGAE